MFIVLEGLDGCGKTTQLSLLASWLTSAGYTAWETAEPTTSIFGCTMAQLHQQGYRNPTIDLALFLADRMHHQQALMEYLYIGQSGVIVLCDRYWHASCAYQADVSGLSMVDIWETHQATGLEAPDITFYLRVTPEIARHRKPGDVDDAILENAYTHYEQMAQDPRYGMTTIDAMRSLGTVQDDIRRHVKAWLEYKGKQHASSPHHV